AEKSVSVPPDRYSPRATAQALALTGICESRETGLPRFGSGLGRGCFSQDVKTSKRTESRADR
ncbi:MAG TPA: hypothetical protein PLT29_08105, partial [Bacteroidales bacterium]|nr:hypothetical protein [Bacteroidales bacterium]